MFAVVKIAGKQYKVTEGAEIIVDSIEGEAGSRVTFTDVLLTEKNGISKVGTPLVAGTSIVATIVAQMQGEKIDVRRYKSKVRERRHIGFRAQQTKLHIETIKGA